MRDAGLPLLRSGTSQMHDQRVVLGPALGVEDAAHRLRLVGVRRQAVDGLGRQADQGAALQRPRRLFDRLLCRLERGCTGLSRLQQRARVQRQRHGAIPSSSAQRSAVACACSTLAPVTLRWPILRPARAWSLPYRCR